MISLGIHIFFKNSKIHNINGFVAARKTLLARGNQIKRLKLAGEMKHWDVHNESKLELFGNTQP